MEPSTGKCINCGNVVTSLYCPSCGQKHPPRKINFVNMWYDFQARIYGFDGMFPRTFKDLTLRPGTAAREFIDGNRVKHYGPVGYFFLMVTVFLLIMSMLSVNFYEFISPVTKSINEVKPQSGQEKFMKDLTSWIGENMKLMSFMIIPFHVLMARAFFKRSGFNLLEHSVMVLYTHGHVYWLGILSLIVFKITGANVISGFQTIVMVGLFSLGCTQLYTYQSKLKASLKGIAASLCAFLLFMVFVVIVSWIYMYLNPEYFEMLRPSNNR